MIKFLIQGLVHMSGSKVQFQSALQIVQTFSDPTRPLKDSTNSAGDGRQGVRMG